MKKALVCGAGGFIGGHLVKKLKREGYWVRGVDIKPHEWSPNAARRVPAARSARRRELPDGAHRGRRHVRRGLPAGRRHGRHGLHPLRRMRDHAQQRADQHPHDRPGRAPGRAALLLLVVGVRLPRHEARRAGNDRSRGDPGASRQRVRLGEALLRAHGRWPTSAATACRCASRASRTATARKAPGPAAARRRRRPCAARWPRPKTAARSRCGATARRCARTPTWTTWWTASTC